MKKLFMLLAFLGIAATSMAQATVTFTVRGGSNYNTDEGCDNAFDNDLGTKWYANSGDQYVDLEASKAIRLTGYTLVTANNNKTEGRLPQEWEFYATNDASKLNNALNNWEGWALIDNVLNDRSIQRENYTAHYYAINAPSTAYKYFRLKFVKSDWQLSEFIPAYSPEYQPPYVAIDGVGGTGSEGYPSICDGNTASKVCTDRAVGYYQYYIFRRSEAVAVSSYKFCTGNDADNRDPEDWELYGMNTNDNPNRDDAAWVLIDEKTGQSLPSERKTWSDAFTITPASAAYNTFMLKIKKVRDGGDTMQFQEFSLNDDKDKSIHYTILKGTGKETSESEGIDKGFDGNVDTKVCTNNRDDDGIVFWFIIKTSSDVAVSGYNFASGNDADSRDPQSWSLYGMKANSDPTRTDDGWTLIDTKTDVTNFPTDRTAWVHYDVVSPTNNEYNYFKLEITKVRSGNMLQFSEFKLDGVEVKAEDKLTAYRSMGAWDTSQGAAYLFDGTPETRLGGNFSKEGNGSYVTFGPASQEAVSITGYSLQVAREGGYYGRIPKSWTLYGGNNTSAPENADDWEEIHSVTNDTQLSLDGVDVKHSTRGYYHLDAPSKAYKYFKIRFTENHGDSGIQLGELVLYYPHDVTTNWMELRDDTNPVFNGVVNVKSLKIDRTIPADKWIGLCLPFNYDIPEGWDVRELKSVVGSGEDASMRFSAASSIVAGKPYIVKPTSEVTSIEVTDKTVGTPASKVTDNGVTMIGNLGQTTIPAGSFYITTDSQLKKLTGGTANLMGFRAYFTVDSGSSVKALSFDLDDEATAIEETLSDSPLKGENIYNLAGQRISKMQRGINIVNGKKILF